ncbi:MAG: YhcH/YjgK/YiaL family protein [Prevotella sp.]|jgi:YhcH/YjgK/YiaL family protein|nr:YhcH/YjgK/YiaL family protein [Prevotella sp.]
MILDSLNNTSKYYALHPLFKEAFEYLISTDFSIADTGKIELKGNDLFLIISDSDMKEASAAKLEVHNKYIDIQMPVSKAETFGWSARKTLEQALSLFDSDRDIQFYSDPHSSLFTAVPGNFVIFFPEDAHAPCIGEDSIRKVVVKIKI